MPGVHATCSTVRSGALCSEVMPPRSTGPSALDERRGVGDQLVEHIAYGQDGRVLRNGHLAAGDDVVGGERHELRL